ncbi:MAG: DUF4870 domain-containing protein [Chitinophagales bacterium]|nr:DUF4870 domain-containing protein [Chitinophagales bacterium]
MEVLNQPDQPHNDNGFKPWGMEPNSFAMLMHFSQFAGYIFPLAGFFVPVFMWASFKNESSLIDQHGKNIINWIISIVIYYVIAGILVVLVIGLLALAILPVISFIFIVIAAVRAADGEVYRYPFTIDFLK